LQVALLAIEVHGLCTHVLPRPPHAMVHVIHRDFPPCRFSRKPNRPPLAQQHAPLWLYFGCQLSSNSVPCKIGTGPDRPCSVLHGVIFARLQTTKCVRFTHTSCAHACRAINEAVSNTSCRVVVLQGGGVYVSGSIRLRSGKVETHHHRRSLARMPSVCVT
jgi:hypothetical protein